MTDVRENDASILDHDRLFRRVPPNHLVPQNDGSLRLSSAAFKDDELSVNIESLMVEQGRLPDDTLAGHPGFFLTSITAGNVRSFGHAVVKDNVSQPNEPPVDPAHGLVLGKKRGSFAKAMVRSHDWIVPPPSPSKE